MVELFYPEAVLNRMNVAAQGNDYDSLKLVHHSNPVATFWAGHNLQEGDWLGLASSLLTEIFSVEFLTPLQDVDTAFSLKVFINLVLILSLWLYNF